MNKPINCPKCADIATLTVYHSFPPYYAAQCGCGFNLNASERLNARRRVTQEEVDDHYQKYFKETE